MERYPVETCSSDADRVRSNKIRHTVFILEQHIPENVVYDEKDDSCHHYLVYVDEQPAGTARLATDGTKGQLGRMAVLKEYRRQGVGRDLVRHIITHARSINLSKIFLHAQASARTFYLAMGFVEEGRPFIEAGIVHQGMIMDLRDRK